MNYLIDGRQIAESVLAKVAAQTSVLSSQGIVPKLAVVLVGDDQASHTYVKRKQMAAAKCGIAFSLFNVPATISQADLIAQITEIQTDPQLSGLIVQLPLPEPLYAPEVLNAVEPQFDVDGLTELNMGKLLMKTAPWLPPTPAACLEIIKSQQISLAGKNVVIIGVGALVGKPLAVILMNERASVTTVNSATTDFANKCLAADIIISGVGKADLVRGTMVKPNALVIDAGVSFVNEVMRGDAAVTEIADHAFVTPTPGGVGPITVAKLLANTVISAARKHQVPTVQL